MEISTGTYDNKRACSKKHTLFFYSKRPEQMSVAAEDVAGIDLFADIVETGLVAVGNDGL